MGRFLRHFIGHLAGALGLAAMATGCSASTGSSASRALAGTYDGSQMEMAAGLELGKDGRFRYALSYGALDEQAEGSWTEDVQGVHLTSDPVKPPRFVVVDTHPIAEPRLHIDLDVPQGMSRQYFSALVTMPDGRAGEEQLSDEGLDLPLRAGEKPVSVAMLLSVYEFKGETVPLPPGNGASLHIRFEPNDLGKVAFVNQLLRSENGALLLERYGRQIRFRRSAR